MFPDYLSVSYDYDLFDKLSYYKLSININTD